MFRNFVLAFSLCIIASNAEAADAKDKCREYAAFVDDPLSSVIGLAQSQVDTDLAFRECTLAVESDPADAEFQFLLGRVLFITEDYDTAFEYLTRSADAGYHTAHYHLGMTYRYGLGRDSDLVKAAQHLQISSDAGHVRSSVILAEIEIALSNSGNPKFQTFEDILAAADHGDLAARHLAGEAYFYGDGVPVDDVKAVALFKLGADGGVLQSQYFYGIYLVDGDIVDKNEALAFQLFEDAGNRGDLRAAFEVALMLQDGRGTQKDEERAVTILTRLAEQANVDAMYFLALAHSQGQGTPEDQALASKWFEAAAEAGDTDAQVFIARRYEEGRGIPQSDERARYWIEVAAESGDEYALEVYSRFLSDGVGGPKNPTKAINVLRGAANAGSAYAQSRLAYLLTWEKGDDESIQEALRWLDPAIAQGDAWAMVQLAELYKNGNGVGQDHERAFDLLQSAADKEFSSSYVSLAAYYIVGGPVEKDYGKARSLLEKAIAENRVEAAIHLAEMEWVGLGTDPSYENAEAILTWAITNFADDPDASYSVVQDMLKRGEIVLEQGRFDAAESDFQTAFGMIDSGGPALSGFYGTAILSLATVRHFRGQYDEASEFYEKWIAIARDDGRFSEQQIASLELGRAFLLSEIGEVEEALVVFKKYVPKFQFTFGHESAQTGMLELLIASTMDIGGLEGDQTSIAVKLANDGLRKVRKAEIIQPAQLARALSIVGRVSAAQGDVDTALEAFSEARSVVERLGIGSHPEVLLGATAYAAVLEESGQSEAALSVLEDATRLMREGRNRAAESGEKVALVFERMRVRQGYAAYIKSLVAQFDSSKIASFEEKAFEVLQDAHFSDAAAALFRMATRSAEVSPAAFGLLRDRDDAAEKWRAWNRRLSQTLITSGDEKSRRSIAAIIEEVDAAAERLKEIERQIDDTLPNYRALVRNEPISISAVQAVLSDREVMISFLVTESGTYSWAITKEVSHLAFSTEFGADNLSNAVVTLRENSRPDLYAGPQRFAKFDAATAYRLYQAFIEPHTEFLKDKSSMLIVPDGALQSLPIGILITAPHTDRRIEKLEDFAKQSWLAREYAITVVPSIQSLTTLRNERLASSPHTPFAGFGNPTLKGSGELQRGIPINALRGGENGLANVEMLRNLSSLPETQTELETMAAVLGAAKGAVRTGDGATEKAVKLADLSDTAVIAFATHGVAAGYYDDFGQPGLILTPPEIATAEDDGFLSSGEISLLKLNAEFVILSACNTASAEGRPGSSGFSGLARSFLHAGARSLLVSHWPVESHSTVELTTQLLLSRKSGRSKAEALQDARIALIDSVDHPEYALPLFWAPFVLVGDGI